MAIRFRYIDKPVVLAVLICLIVFYSGLCKTPSRYPFISLISKDKVTGITGTILSSPVKSNSGKYYTSLLSAIETSTSKGEKSSSKGRIIVYIPSEIVESFYPGKLYSKAKAKGAYLFEAGGIYSFSGKFTKNGFVSSACNSCSWQNTITGKIDFFRALCRLQIKRLMYGWGEAGGLLLALLCGSKEYTNEETSNAFRNAGLSHILALSGMHLSMFSALAIFFGKKAGQKKLTFIIRIIALILFVWFAGFSPSLLRAFICAMLTIVASMSGSEQTDRISILCFSFLFQCVISPSDINNIGFMLSYGALAGIIIFSRISGFIYFKLFPKPIAASLSASTGAQIFTAPVSIKFFGIYSPIGIIATTVISPLITIFIYSGLMLMIISLIFPIFQKPSGFFINLQYTVIKYSVLAFSHMPIVQIK